MKLPSPKSLIFSARAGFSLIEIVIVLTLIAVMAMTVTPVFRGSLAAARADHAARDVFAELVSAQERAVAHSAEYRVYFDRKKNSYWVAHAPFDATEGYAVIENIDGKIVAIPERLNIAKVTGRGVGGSTDYLAFYPHGGTDVGEVQLADRSDRRRIYRIETTGTHVLFRQPE